MSMQYGSDITKQMNVLLELEGARRAAENAYKDYFDITPLMLPGMTPNYSDIFRSVLDNLEVLVKETAVGIANAAQIKIMPKEEDE